MRVPATMLAAAFAVVLAGSARADVYTWTDADGVVHFTNIKPSGNAKKVLSSTPDGGTKAAVQRGTCERCDKVPSTDNSPERFHRYDAIILEASALYRIPVPLIRAVIKVESDYDPKVVSSADCKGLMQVHPEVYVDMGTQGDVFDPRTNIMTGTRLLRWLANQLDGDLVLTIAGYHAGMGSLGKYGYTVPPYPYTRQYVRMVLDHYYRYKAEEARVRATGATAAPAAPAKP
ncbi:MAG: lytic transglycosylase domain-containing protein [Deltaproteobacteria bacterium]|nr:lytic transglycosylase domain-containing protein [Deltaproteobacteria bacterium]MCW5808129.1 lytic transglycosylase domain-containing protein [Deltaproteobacteria bacterium]